MSFVQIASFWYKNFVVISITVHVIKTNFLHPALRMSTSPDSLFPAGLPTHLAPSSFALYYVLLFLILHICCVIVSTVGWT